MGSTGVFVGFCCTNFVLVYAVVTCVRGSVKRWVEIG